MQPPDRVSRRERPAVMGPASRVDRENALGHGDRNPGGDGSHPEVGKLLTAQADRLRLLSQVPATPEVSHAPTVRINRVGGPLS